MSTTRNPMFAYTPNVYQLDANSLLERPGDFCRTAGMIKLRRSSRRVRTSALVAGIGLLAATGLLIPITSVGASPSRSASETITSSGLKAGAIKHVWLIILENKSYDSTFTGLNQNSYLWQTLPAQGALLTNYYGTGHFSMDNYISLVSGQSPSYATQDDCSTSANMTNNDTRHHHHRPHRYRN